MGVMGVTVPQGSRVRMGTKERKMSVRIDDESGPKIAWIEGEKVRRFPRHVL